MRTVKLLTNCFILTICIITTAFAKIADVYVKDDKVFVKENNKTEILANKIISGSFKKSKSGNTVAFIEVTNSKDEWNKMVVFSVKNNKRIIERPMHKSDQIIDFGFVTEDRIYYLRQNYLYKTFRIYNNEKELPIYNVGGSIISFNPDKTIILYRDVIPRHGEYGFFNGCIWVVFFGPKFKKIEEKIIYPDDPNAKDNWKEIFGLISDIIWKNNDTAAFAYYYGKSELIFVKFFDGGKYKLKKKQIKDMELVKEIKWVEDKLIISGENKGKKITQSVKEEKF